MNIGPILGSRIPGRDGAGAAGVQGAGQDPLPRQQLHVRRDVVRLHEVRVPADPPGAGGGGGSTVGSRWLTGG